MVAVGHCMIAVILETVIMAALCNRAGHYIFVLWFLSFYLLLFSSPNLSGRRLDVYHTSTQWCGPSASLMEGWIDLERRSEMCCTRLAGNTEGKKIAIWHHRTSLSGYIFGTKACIDNRKKLVK